MSGAQLWRRNFPQPFTVIQADVYGNEFVFNDTGGEVLRCDQETLSYRTEKGIGDIQSEEDLRNAARSDSGYGFRDIPPFDMGHEFYTRKRTTRLSHPAVRIEHPGNSVSFRGPLIPDIGSPGIQGGVAYRDIPRLTSNETNLYGTRAINACAPTHPSANVAAFLGELREQLPQIIGASLLRDRANFFRSLGGEYLNVEFGWKPFISDLRKMIQAVATSSKVLAQYERDSGRIVRRRFSFPKMTETGESVITTPGHMPHVFFTEHYSNTLYAPGVTSEVHKLSLLETSYWFAGAFTYYVDKGDSAFGSMVRYEQLANRLLGTRITPDVLWELTPWSWLADWVGNLGSIISNATLLSQDGLVMRYGYLMRRTSAIDTYTPMHADFRIGMFGHTSAQLSVIQKERARATPFGFGINADQFTGRQWAILAALGLSRGGRSSW
jgi:hypothetical protein